MIAAHVHVGLTWISNEDYVVSAGVIPPLNRGDPRCRRGIGDELVKPSQIGLRQSLRAELGHGEERYRGSAPLLPSREHDTPLQPGRGWCFDRAPAVTVPSVALVVRVGCRAFVLDANAADCRSGRRPADWADVFRAGVNLAGVVA